MYIIWIIIFSIVLLLALIFITSFDTEYNSTPIIHQKTGWIYPKEKILYDHTGSFEFGGFPNENTLLFYEKGREANHPIYLQIQDGKNMNMVVAGKTITVTKVDKENNRIEVKMQEKE